MIPSVILFLIVGFLFGWNTAIVLAVVCAVIIFIVAIVIDAINPPDPSFLEGLEGF